ncbi:MAG: Crp/Fnr family transcriptional regulator [Flavobacteriales bacterium]|jgi:CRP-like cAMP-binding protein
MENSNATLVTEENAYHDLFNYIQQRVTLSETDKAFIKQRFTLRNIKRKTYFLREGDLGFEQAFIIAGTMRVFYIDGKTQEHVLYFGFKDWWIGDLASFELRSPSQLNVQALEDTWVLAFTHDGIDEIFQQIPQMERLFRMMAQRTLAVLQKRLFLTVSASAEERYLALIERHPSIEQLVPQHQIASYLGILPESLSRMKKQRIQKSRGQKAN